MNILIPVDGTELSLHVTRFALRLAQEGLKTRIILANAQDALARAVARGVTDYEQLILGGK